MGVLDLKGRCAPRGSCGSGRATIPLQMPRHPITAGWSIELDEGFERWTQEGDLVLSKPPRTVYAAVFDVGAADADEAIAQLLESRPGVPHQTFDRVEPGLAAHAYLLPEEDRNRSYWGLNTWTASRGSVACVTFYFDSPQDLAWALPAWRSINRGDGAKQYLS